MLKLSDDPGADLSEIFDEAHLTGSNMLQGTKNMTTIVTAVRNDLNMKLRSYIKRRDHQMYNLGAQKGKDDESRNSD